MLMQTNDTPSPAKDKARSQAYLGLLDGALSLIIEMQ